MSDTTIALPGSAIDELGDKFGDEFGDKSGARASRPRPIWYYLVALVVLAVVPMLLIAVVLVVGQASTQRAAIDQSMRSTARAVSVSVDLILEANRTAIETLAQSELIDRADWTGLYAIASRVAAQRGAVFISLFDTAGNQKFNTGRPYGTPLPTPFRQSQPMTADSPPLGDVSSLKRVLQTGTPSNSDLYISLAMGKPLITVDVPVSRKGVVRYAMNMSFEPEVLYRVLREYHQQEALTGVVIDRNGFIITRLSDTKYTGKKGPDALLEQLKGEDSGSGDAISYDGVPVHYTYKRSAQTGWTVAIATPGGGAYAPVRRVLLIGVALALVGLAIGVVSALVLGRRLAASVAALAEAARLGTRPKISGMPIRELTELEASLEQATLVRQSEAYEHGARMRAERESQAKDEFLAMLGHELRNPLAAVANAAEVMNRSMDPAAKDSVRNAAAIVKRQAGVLARLLDDLLDVGRFVTGKISIRAAPVDLGALVQRTVDSVRASGQLEHHRCSLDCEPAWIQADAGRIEQVVGNLLTNAIKYTPAGRGISVSVRCENHAAVLKVRDEGIGIEAALLDRVFDVFVQGPRSLDRAKGGLGIGLTLVKRIVELHGGEVKVRSEGAERGSEFEVRLPVIKQGETADADATIPLVAGRDVLVVEDNEDARRMLADVLRLSGHAVREAADGTVAIALARERAPEFAFVDIGLPGIDGYEVARCLRELLGDAVMLVAITGYGMPEDRERTEAAGFDLHLVKPVDPRSIERVLSARRRASG